MIDLATHPWMRGLFGDDQIAGIFSADNELKRMLQVEAAWTRALGDVASAEEPAAIAATIETADIAPQDLAGGFARDGVAIPELVRLLKARVGVEAAQWVHRGLTSQDVMDTALTLALGEVLAVVSERLCTLDQELSDLQDRFGTARLQAFTRMQPALETSAKEVVARWRQPLARLIRDLNTLKPQTEVIQWGGPIGARDHESAKELGAAFAAHLKLSDPGHAWHTDRTLIADVAHLLTRITTATGKIGEDIALMSAVGPEQITLSGGGSSAMPHKNNPVKAETLIALADFALPLQASLALSARHEAARSGQAWTLEWLALPQLFVVSGAGLLRASTLLMDIKSIGKT